jgi:N-acetylmuramoyl-L-alanine amidase CwlA
MKFPAPSPTYLGPAARTTAGDNKPINRIVIHSTVSPCKAGQARKTADYFRSSNARGSAHYATDPAEAVQIVFDSVIAWHAPPNRHSIGVEMCEFPAPDKRRWRDAEHKAMFRVTVKLVAGLCVAYDVPPWYVGRLGLLAGRRGITTHADVSKAFKQSTHWDPGGWPRLAFMRAVRAEVKRIKKETR